ncbi:cysteine hydrolase family protein [Paeniglutamicibacter sp.]|uniref:cysteine hydrolase family protein n=1 Tax=Paeniglutamicibacter sp. TaxID=1934391 RepID=UPI003988B9D4
MSTATMSRTRTRHLVVIDMQRIFRRKGDWHVPRYDEAAAGIIRLAAALPAPIMTRFVRDPLEEGAWEAYYDRWDSTRLTREDSAWDLELPGLDSGQTLDLSTFGKWGPRLEALVPVGHEIVLTGVATDCCVLSTALAAVDAGRFVTVVSDACAGQNDTSHDGALAMLALLAPMIRIVSTQELLDEL